jgi:V8-like Glu-specific endopeptidase
MTDFIPAKTNGLDHEIVLGTDERRRVGTTEKPPFRWICSLEVEFPEPVINALGVLEHIGKRWQELPTGDKGCGSGLLISPNEVLTASHVLMGFKIVPGRKPGEDMLQPVLASRVRVIPGRNDHHHAAPHPFGIWTANKVQVNPIFKKRLSGNPEAITKNSILAALPFDVGIVELKAKITRYSNRRMQLGDKVGWWGKDSVFRILPVSEQQRKTLTRYVAHIGGFPGDKGPLPCSVPYTSSGAILTAAPKIGGRRLDLLLYQADTSAGMSGSPVWIENQQGHKYLVGVHSSFSTYQADQQVNIGALLTLTLRLGKRYFSSGQAPI